VYEWEGGKIAKVTIHRDVGQARAAGEQAAAARREDPRR